VPRDAVLHALGDYRRRLRLAELSVVVVAAAAAAGVILATAWLSGVPPAINRLASLAAFSIGVAAFGMWSWQRWTTARVAATIESRRGGLDNLVVTAEEIARRTDASWHPVIKREVASAAVSRLADLAVSDVQPLGRPLTLGVGAVTALAILVAALPSATDAGDGAQSSAA
jgi:hypothetical protein